MLEQRWESGTDPGDVIYVTTGVNFETKVPAVLHAQRGEVSTRQAHAELHLCLLDTAIGERGLQIREVDRNSPEAIRHTGSSGPRGPL